MTNKQRFLITLSLFLPPTTALATCIPSTTMEWSTPMGNSSGLMYNCLASNGTVYSSGNPCPTYNDMVLVSGSTVLILHHVLDCDKHVDALRVSGDVRAATCMPEVHK